MLSVGRGFLHECMLGSLSKDGEFKSAFLFLFSFFFFFKGRKQESWNPLRGCIKLDSPPKYGLALPAAYSPEGK